MNSTVLQYKNYKNIIFSKRHYTFYYTERTSISAKFTTGQLFLYELVFEPTSLSIHSDSVVDVCHVNQKYFV